MYGKSDKIVIIDGNSLVNRAYFAIQRPMITKDGFYTQGIYGFLSMLSKIMTDLEPTHMLVAFDRKAPTFRHLEYPEYKAGRKGMPDELAMEMPVLKELLKALGIRTYEIDGFEADDILGTTAKLAESEDLRCYIVTGDKDALQLASDKTSVIITKKGISEFKLYDDAAMTEEYGFSQASFIDFKALKGDSSDNIPGVPGVGDKTAQKLILQFGNVEDLIAGADSIENAKLRDKIKANADTIRFSKRLATIVTDVPLDYSLEDTRIAPKDYPKLIELYGRLEFRTYLSKLLKEKEQAEEQLSLLPPEGGEAQKPSEAFPEPVRITDPSEAEKALKEALDGLREGDELVCSISGDDSHLGASSIESFSFLRDGRLFILDCGADAFPGVL
ncbi:MAG: DNA polymerase I, partial [Firmicutes bacterium]|nr:DNA polymerase I [Bacillota bacterium]